MGTVRPRDPTDHSLLLVAEWAEGVRVPAEWQRLRLRSSVARLGPTARVRRRALVDLSELHADAARKDAERHERSGVHTEGVRVPAERLRWLRASVASSGAFGKVKDAVE